MKKRFFLLTAAFSLLISFTAFSYSEKSVSVYLNGMNLVFFDNQPYKSEDGEIYIPARELCGQIGYFVSYELPKTTWLTQFVPGTRINTGVILAVLFVVACYLLIYKTKLGYEMRAVGINKEFAKYGGINIKKVTILAAVLGAAIAGIGGMTQVMGIYRKFNWNAETGYGWDGIAVAIIARNNPLLIVPASIFLAYLRVGGGMLNLNSDVPTEMISIIQAVIILLITAESFLSSWKTKLTVSNALEVKD